MDYSHKISGKIVDHYFREEEISIANRQKKAWSDVPLLNGIRISIQIINKLSSEIAKLNKNNKKLYTKLQHLSTTAPHVGAAVSLGASLILKDPNVAIASGPFLVGTGPVISVILHLRNEQQIKNITKKIDDSILEIISSDSQKKEISFNASEIDQILEVWNFLRRPDFTSLIKRVDILRNLNLDNPSFTALIISSFVLLEKSGMTEKEKILEIGINRILSLLEKNHNKLFELFIFITLNSLYREGRSKKIVEKTISQNTYLSTEQKSYILLKPSAVIKSFPRNKHGQLLADWYKSVLIAKKRIQIDEF